MFLQTLKIIRVYIVMLNENIRRKRVVKMILSNSLGSNEKCISRKRSSTSTFSAITRKIRGTEITTQV